MNFLDHTIDIPEKLFDAFKAKPYKLLNANEIIYNQGEIAKNFYYLKKGKVQIFVNSQDGLEKVLTVFRTGQILGEASFFDGFPRMSSAKTICTSEIITIDKADIISYFKEEPSLALNFIELLSQKVRMLSNEIDNISFFKADKRIAQYLLNIDNLSINCTHEEIARTVGASRVTVSRILNKFCKYEWIHTKYSKIIIINKTALMNFLET